MKRNYFIALTLFAVISLCALVQLSAELTPLEQAEKALSVADGKLGNANLHLTFPHTEMWSKYNEWVENEEAVNRDNLLAAATTDPIAWAAATTAQVADISDKLRLSAELAGKISAFNTQQKAVNKAAKELQTAWDTYFELAKHLSSGERYVIINTPAQPNYPAASLTCPACNVTYSGENLGGIGDHVTLCSVNGHSMSPYPYFSCESSGCPLSNEHHTFSCRGRCGDLFPQPYIAPDPEGQGVGSYTKVYYDHGVKENGLEDKCPEDVSGPLPCNHTRYSCQTPACPNDTNHLIDGECGKKGHKVRKGDTAAVAAHEAVGTSCPATYTYPSGYTISCLIHIEYKCDEHSIHDYDTGPGTNPPSNGYNNNNNSDSTPDCSYCTDGCSSCQSSSDDSSPDG